jgi:hypothetical protein
MEYDNTNSGALFKAEKKTDSHPDYNGSINIDGTDYWLSAWLKKDKNGNTYMSLSRGDAKNKQPGGQGERTEQPHESDMDMDIPF